MTCATVPARPDHPVVAAGANGLANPRDFRAPTACCEEPRPQHTLIHKLGGQLWQAQQSHTPFDVVAWHGNYVPYVYDLALFSPVNTVRVDHADPSIFTVLTCASAVPGTHCCCLRC